MANTLEIQIKASMDEFKRQMGDAASSLRSAASQMGTDFSAIGKGAGEAEKGTRGWVDALKEHKSEMRAEGGMTKVLARDLEKLGLDAHGAGGEIAHLVSAFAIGGGIGGGLAVIGAIAGYFREAGEESRKWAEEAEARISKLAGTADDLRNKLAGITPEVARWSAIQTEVVAKQAEIARLMEEARRSAAVMNTSGYDPEVYKADAKAIQAKIDKLKEEARQLEVNRDLQRGVAEGANLQKQESSRSGQQSDEANKVIYADIQAANKKYNATQDLDLKNYAFELGLEAKKDQELDKLADKALAEDNARIAAEQDLDLKNYANELGLQVKLDQEKDRLADQALAEDNARMERAAAEQAAIQKRQMRTLAGEAQQLGSAIGEAMAGLATGTKDVGQAMASAFSSVVQQVVRAAIAQVTANAMVAGSGAAASQSAIPIIGPILAISAMGAMVTAVLGLLSSMPSAAGGWNIPKGLNPLVQAHGGEHIIPADIAQRYEQGAPGGGGDTFHITAIDSQSFIQALRNNSTGLVKVLRELTRNGRM